jgi:hypothetical protein
LSFTTNFPARDLQYTEVAAASVPFHKVFAGLHVASLSISNELGPIPGWGLLQTIEEYNARLAGR